MVISRLAWHALASLWRALTDTRGPDAHVTAVCLQIVCDQRCGLERKSTASEGNFYGAKYWGVGCGSSPLLLAAHAQRRQVVKTLLDSGANTLSRAKIGVYPLHVAAAHGDISSVEELLLAGANTEVLDEHGRTPLHTAAFHGHTEVLRFLLAVGSDLSSTDTKGNSPLHLSAESAKACAVELLVAEGARIGVSPNGWSPLSRFMAKGKRCCHTNSELRCIKQTLRAK